MVSGKQLVAEMALKRAEEQKRFAKLEVSQLLKCLEVSQNFDPER